ncbi:MAG: hypothetical protein Q9217_006328 [Psora testacea]
MPYTPPSQQSLVASQSNTPHRRLSLPSLTTTHCQVQERLSNGSRPGLPAISKSYLHKHRRSPSICKSPYSFAEPPTPEGTPPETRCSNAEEENDGSTSSRKARNFKAARVNGSTFNDASPSCSPQSSSDDELSAKRGRARDVGGPLAELQAAIRTIEQRRESSPVPPGEEDKARATLDMSKTLSDPAAKMDGVGSDSSAPSPLSASARKISHSRSNTDGSAVLDFPRNKFDSPARSTSESEMDEMEEEDLQIKPSLIRKKSGELVRPALRPPSTGRRPSSVPGTPTYAKAVHFQDNSLEHVRHFLQVDRPIAVSANTSPVEGYEEEMEFPFADHHSRSNSPSPYDWEIRLTNFPRDTIDRSAWPVRTENVYLSSDTRVLMGNVAVRNLSFHKLVVARFTLDYWKTTSEVVAEYNHDVRKKQVDDGYDRFTFNIKLEDQTNLENKTMFFCVRYNVRGREYWDNNNSTNYQIDFLKKFKPQNGEQGKQPNSTRPLNGLPRSNPSQPRPRSMPSFDDFSTHRAPYDFFLQSNSMAGDSRIRLRNKPSSDFLPDAPTRPKATSNQQAFGNRYDFGASLSAAIQAASASMPKVSTPTTESTPVLRMQQATNANTNVNTNHHSDKSQTASSTAIKPTALTTEKPALQSPSYHELLDKYCFFGSGKPSSSQTCGSGVTNVKSHPAHVDGAADTASPPPAEASPTSNEVTGSATPSPPASTFPAHEETKSLIPTPNVSSPNLSRATAPATGGPIIGSRNRPPGFGYPYHPGMQNGFFDTHTPTAIRG